MEILLHEEIDSANRSNSLLDDIERMVQLIAGNCHRRTQSQYAAAADFIAQSTRERVIEYCVRVVARGLAIAA